MLLNVFVIDVHGALNRDACVMPFIELTEQLLNCLKFHGVH